MSLLYKKQVLIFITIFLIGLFFRTYNLSSVAIHPHLDEVSNGYNAYSLLKTGADEFGKQFPALLQTYDDWRPAIYVYLTIPVVALLGLDVVSVRLASVILSMISLVLIFFVTKVLVHTIVKHNRDYPVRASAVPFISMFLFAISPWSIYFSRQSHEVNSSIMFLFVGVLCFLKFVTSQKRQHFFLPLSAVGFALSFFAYHGAKLFVLSFCLGLIILYRKELLRFKKIAVASGVLGLIVLTPLFLAFTEEGATIRLAGVSVFNQAHDIVETSAGRLVRDTRENNIIGLLFDNRRVGFGERILANYFDNFNPSFLYVHNDNLAYSIPGVGVFHLFELLLFVSGMYFLIVTSLVKKRAVIVVVLWLLFYPLASAISTQSPHPLRTYVGIFPFLFIEAVGAAYILYVVAKSHHHTIRVAGYATTGIVVALSLLYFFNSYFYNYRDDYAKKYQYGVTDALRYALDTESAYDKIIVSYNGNLAQSYMYYLFTTSYDPYQYQQHGGTTSGGFAVAHQIGKFHFENPELVLDEKGIVVDTNMIGFKNPPKTLYVVDVGDLPESAFNQNPPAFTLLKKFSFPDGKPSIFVITLVVR